MIAEAELSNVKLQEEYYDNMFNKDGYKDVFEAKVNELLATKTSEGLPPDVAWRIYASDVITSAYVEQTGKTPDGNQVQRLANWLLLEMLSDSHPDKVTREDYPVMTKKQLKTRYARERADENIPETHTIQKYLGGKKQSNYNKSD